MAFSLTLVTRHAYVCRRMTRAEKLANLGAVVVPFAATLAAIVLLWNAW